VEGIGLSVKINESMYSSDTAEWPTPQPFFDALNAEFQFTLDACATPENAKCIRYFTADDDGLTQRWTGVVWMNPPYGTSMRQWVRKAYEEAQHGAIVVALVPCRTDTRWWHDYVMRAAEVRLVRGRLTFTGGSQPAPFPNAVAVFRPGDWSPTLGVIDRGP
jgi:phage N-6-adenine-methyltransferase